MRGLPYLVNKKTRKVVLEKPLSFAFNVCVKNSTWQANYPTSIACSDVLLLRRGVSHISHLGIVRAGRLLVVSCWCCLAGFTKVQRSHVQEGIIIGLVDDDNDDALSLLGPVALLRGRLSKFKWDWPRGDFRFEEEEDDDPLLLGEAASAVADDVVRTVGGGSGGAGGSGDEAVSCVTCGAGDGSVRVVVVIPLVDAAREVVARSADCWYALLRRIGGLAGSRGSG